MPSFPRGSPGAGLLALRLGVLAGMLACNPVAGLPLPPPVSGFLTGVAALALVLGLFTSWIAWLAGACALLGLIQAMPDARAIAPPPRACRSSPWRCWAPALTR